MLHRISFRIRRSVSSMAWDQKLFVMLILFLVLLLAQRITTRYHQQKLAQGQVLLRSGSNIRKRSILVLSTSCSSSVINNGDDNNNKYNQNVCSVASEYVRQISKKPNMNIIVVSLQSQQSAATSIENQQGRLCTSKFVLHPTSECLYHTFDSVQHGVHNAVVKFLTGRGYVNGFDVISVFTNGGGGAAAITVDGIAKMKSKLELTFFTVVSITQELQKIRFDSKKGEPATRIIFSGTSHVLVDIPGSPYATPRYRQALYNSVRVLSKVEQTRLNRTTSDVIKMAHEHHYRGEPLYLVNGLYTLAFAKASVRETSSMVNVVCLDPPSSFSSLSGGNQTTQDASPFLFLTLFDNKSNGQLWTHLRGAPRLIDWEGSYPASLSEAMARFPPSPPPPRLPTLSKEKKESRPPRSLFDRVNIEQVSGAKGRDGVPLFGQRSSRNRFFDEE
eukprot:PhM_4_TR6323/c0_g1_i1/m.10311